MADLFPRVSKLDEVNGRVSLRKVFGVLSAADVAALVARIITWAKRGPAPDAALAVVPPKGGGSPGGAFLVTVGNDSVSCEPAKYWGVIPLAEDPESVWPVSRC